MLRAPVHPGNRSSLGNESILFPSYSTLGTSEHWKKKIENGGFNIWLASNGCSILRENIGR